MIKIRIEYEGTTIIREFDVSDIAEETKSNAKTVVRQM